MKQYDEKSSGNTAGAGSIGEKSRTLNALYDVKPFDSKTGVFRSGVEKSTVDLGSLRKKTEMKIGNFSFPESLEYVPLKVRGQIAHVLENTKNEIEKYLEDKANSDDWISVFGGKRVSSQGSSYRRIVSIKKHKEKQFAPEQTTVTLANITEATAVPVLDHKMTLDEIIESMKDDKKKIILTADKADSVSEDSKLLDNYYVNNKSNHFATASNSLDIALSQNKELLSEPHSFLRFRTGLKNKLGVKILSKNNKRIFAVLFGIALFVGVKFFADAIEIKNNVTEQGSQAYKNLDVAKTALENLNFGEAAQAFALASKNFELASSKLFEFNSSIASMIDSLTGNKVESAQNLSEAGRLIAGAGQDLSEAITKVQQNNILSLAMAVNTDLEQNGVNDFLKDFRSSLIKADRNIAKARTLLANIDESIIPADKREVFVDFESKLPLLSEFINGAIDYSGTMMDIMGQAGTMRYLVLFQNSSEIRPNGGFFGSYAVAEFNKGILKRFDTDDVYNLDGQLKEKIIPPLEMQGITDTWGTRDAAWFGDFPTSAQKVLEFYRKATGEFMDGVITVNSDVVISLLKTLGPVELRSYGITLTADNFLEEVQSEIEYGKNRKQPKTILYELTPILLNRLGSLGSDDWFNVFQNLMSEIENKNIQAYFINPTIEKFALANGLGGELDESYGDYLFITHSNIKGSKTDLFTNNSEELMVTVNNDGSAVHNLKITRTHQGGTEKYGFYNKINYDYIRLYLPENSTVQNLSGANENPFKPLVDYSWGEYQEDYDLANVEHPIKADGNWPAVFTKEKNRKVVGVWMIINPQETRTVEISWTTPAAVDNGEYELYLQKQSGFESKLKAVVQLDRNYNVSAKAPSGLVLNENKWVLNEDFNKDKKIILQFSK